MISALVAATVAAAFLRTNTGIVTEYSTPGKVPGTFSNWIYRYTLTIFRRELRKHIGTVPVPWYPSAGLWIWMMDHYNSHPDPSFPFNAKADPT
jgi:hypothetical protein